MCHQRLQVLAFAGLRRAMGASFLLMLAAACAQATEAEDLWREALAVRPAVESLAAHARIAPVDEPGTRLRIVGTMFASDGVTPLQGVLVYAYHTDAGGLYSRGPEPRRRLRLVGWARTDAEGRFAFDTIRPGPYPGRRIPAHVHFMAEGAGYPPQWLHDLQFAGDPLHDAAHLAQAEAQGIFAEIVPVKVAADGSQSCEVRFRLAAKSNL